MSIKTYCVSRLPFRNQSVRGFRSSDAQHCLFNKMEIILLPHLTSTTTMIKAPQSEPNIAA